MGDFGKIRQSTTFNWEIPRLGEIVDGKEWTCPEFEFDGKTWSLCMSKEEDCGVTCVGILMESINGGVSIQSYRMGIKDAEGKDFWTSDLISHTFDACDERSHRVKIHSWHEKPRDNLYLYITFSQGSDPPSEGMLSKDLKDMYLSGEDSDVTLDVKGRKFRVHTLILKWRSPVLFRLEMLGRESGDVRIVVCDPDAFHEFMLYLYSGRFERLDINNMNSLHNIALKYGVEGLAATCVRFMIHNMTADNFSEFVAVGLRHCDLELKKSASKFLAEN